MKSLRNLTVIALTAVLAFVFSGCSSDGGDDPVLPLPPAHVHAYSDSWTSNETHHWHAATNIINLRIKNCFFDLQSTYLLS